MPPNPEDLMMSLQRPGKMAMDDSMMEDEEMDAGAEEEGMEEPRASSADGGTVFLDENLFPDGCKIGDTVLIKATVTKHGAKYGVTPEEITREQDGAGEATEEGAEGY